MKGFKNLEKQVDELHINKLVNVLTSLNNFKTKLDDLDVGKLKTFPLDRKFNTLKTKVNESENSWCNYFNLH